MFRSMMNITYNKDNDDGSNNNTHSHSGIVGIYVACKGKTKLITKALYNSKLILLIQKIIIIDIYGRFFFFFARVENSIFKYFYF